MENNKRRRQNSLVESSKTVKGIFKKDDLDDSLSASEWGLIIDDNYRSKVRNRSVRLDEEPLTLICEWNFCCQAFSEYEPYITHLEHHLEEYDLADLESLNCAWIDCSYNANSSFELRQHLCFHGYHTKLKSVGKNVEFRAKLPQCTQSEHFVVPVENYVCQWECCSERFGTVCEFFQHIRFHIFHNPKGEKEGAIRCCWKGCNRSVISQYRLTEHMRIHTREKLLACPTCGHLFASKTKFCDHRRRQLPLNLQSYLCSQCSKFFPSERLLRDHMRLHINQYKCSLCEMTCPKPSILAKHFRYKHLTEKPYKCNQCDYKCVSKHNLDIHVKKHDPESQFQCSDCGYKCRSTFGLERHCQKTHGKDITNVYECHNCKKQFIRGGHLTKHLMKVHNYHWPSGHSRFRYKEDPDGVYRLQTVRYETLDVTEEIIKSKKNQAPKDSNRKYKVLKRQTDGVNAVDTFDVVEAEDDEDEEEEEEEEAEENNKKKKKTKKKKVVITIDDLDSKGNVLKTQTEVSEVVLDMVDLGDVEMKDEVIVVPPRRITRGRKRKR